MLETKSSVGYVADIHSNDLEEIFKFVAKTGHKNTMKSTIINITQNRFMMCASPFSKKLEEKFLHNCPEANTEISALQIQNRFKRERKATILKVSNKTVVLTHGEDIALAEIKVRRNIIYKKTQLRRIDCKTLVKLLENLHARCATANRFLKSDDKEALMTDRYTVTDITPRRVVRTEQEESVFPFKGDIFKNPPMPNPVEEVVVGEEVKYPIQASDDAMDCMSSLSMAPSGQSMFSSQGEGSSQSRSSYLSGFATPFSNSRRSENSSIDSTSFNSSIARYDVYASSDRRRSTFQKPEWKVYEKPDIGVLVDQGFFFTSREDLVRCFMCGIGLKDWVRGDDVVKEHAKHSSKCAYLLQKIGKVEVDRIQTEISSSESSSLSWNQLPYKIRSPQYQRMDARLATFSSFPTRIHIPHQELAVAGLFFTGQGDLCRCFTCDGGLKDWTDGDDPCKEHATYFSHCEYINQLKGRDYVRTMQQRRQQKQQTGATGGGSQPEQYSSAMQAMERLDISSPDGSGMVFSQLKDMGYSDSDVLAASAELKKKGVSKPNADDFVNTILDMQEQRQAAERAGRQSEGATSSATNAPEDDLNALSEENERLAQMIQCMLCVDEEPDMLFLPCAHHRICHKCSQNITLCPVCGNFIKEKVRTYRA